MTVDAKMKEPVQERWESLHHQVHGGSLSAQLDEKHQQSILWENGIWKKIYSKEDDAERNLEMMGQDFCNQSTKTNLIRFFQHRPGIEGGENQHKKHKKRLPGEQLNSSASIA